MAKGKQENIDLAGECMGMFETAICAADLGYMRWLMKEESIIDPALKKRWIEELRTPRMKLFIETAEKFRGLGFHEYITKKEEEAT